MPRPDSGTSTSLGVGGGDSAIPRAEYRAPILRSDKNPSTVKNVSVEMLSQILRPVNLFSDKIFEND